MQGKVHQLKILRQFYYDVKSGKKSFEIRYNDRDYQVGDILCLTYWDGKKFDYSHPPIFAEVVYATEAFQKDNHIVMSIIILKQPAQNWPPELREYVFGLHSKYGWTFTEIADRFKITKGSVAGMVNRCRDG